MLAGTLMRNSASPWAGGSLIRALTLLALTILALVPLVAADTDANTNLQPGTEVSTPVGGCSLNFVFKDASNTYIGTAGHCASGTGGRVSTPGIGAWGTIVVDIDGATDFALIRVDAAKLGLVRADVQHWGGPTGVIGPSETAPGDLLAIYGYGIGFSLTEPSRAKQGVLLDHTPTEYVADTWAVNGDSGGPVLHKATGKALGVISSFNLPISTDIGPTIPAIQAALAARGYNVALQTAASSGQTV